MNTSLFQALGIIDCAVLRYLGHNQFDVVFCRQDWFSLLFPNVKSGGVLTLDEQSAFLVDFMEDAEAFWQQHHDGQVHSGIWTENVAQTELHLEAIAAFTNNERFLIINNVQHEYEHQQNTLQVARELLITHDKVQSQHHYLQDRLASVLNQNASLLELNLPIQQAIEHASLGVIITDAQFVPISINPAAWNLFELEHNNPIQNPLQLFRDLFERQYPEHSRILSNHSKWSGELYWHSPPHFSKWLQAEMHAIVDEMGEFKHWVITIGDITRIKFLLQSNESLALHDSLTGLPNRQHFWQTIEQSILAEKDFFVVYLDIDQFNRINELHGHLTGDAMLISVSKRIKKRLQKGDFLARIGADQFAIIVSYGQRNHSESHTDGEQKLKQIAELADAIYEDSKAPHFSERDERCHLQLRIGIAHYPQDATQAESLMKAADLALHAAKLFAQESIQFYSADLKEASQARLQMEMQLRDAIANQQLQIYLQPIIDLASGKVTKAEALLRWFPNEGQAIAPDVFIPIAEQSGLIYPLGKWVIAKVCDILATFRRQNINVKLSLNVSPRQVSDHKLFDFIKSTAEQAGIDAHKLELELTEGVLVDNYQKAQHLLTALRKMGVTIAIDDFGTGYSSLSYLKNLPIDHLKIDRSFIRDIDKNENDRAIVLAILAMASQLKLRVIAEGVETPAQQTFLKEHQCASAQGFLYAKPMPLVDFVNFIKQQ